jgi:hypothetical protein
MIEDVLKRVVKKIFPISKNWDTEFFSDRSNGQYAFSEAQIQHRTA